MSPSATPAMQNQGGCRQVPRLPRETKVDAAKCHACHAKCRGVTGDQNGPKRTTRASPVPLVPRLPRKVEVDAAKCHACHVKRKWMPPSATRATQSAAVSPATKTGPSAPPEPAQCH